MIFERVTYIVQAAQYINVNTKDTLIDGLHCDRRIDTVLKINMIFEHVAYIIQVTCTLCTALNIPDPANAGSHRPL